MRIQFVCMQGQKTIRHERDQYEIIYLFSLATLTCSFSFPLHCSGRDKAERQSDRCAAGLAELILSGLKEACRPTPPLQKQVS
jgi:hypothetical protein